MYSVGDKIRFKNVENGNIYTGKVIDNTLGFYSVDTIVGGRYVVNFNDVVSEDEWKKFVKKHSHNQ